jgi:hypothetical protein
MPSLNSDSGVVAALLGLCRAASDTSWKDFPYKAEKPMRPNTLREAYERLVAGEPREKALSEFLDTFYGLADTQARRTAFADEPPVIGDARLDALAGAIAEYLSKRHGILAPEWALGGARYLQEPWFTTDRPGAGINEFLWHSSPAEFRSRNIFTEAMPLRRASHR